MRTFSGNFTNKDLRDDPAKQAADRQLRQLTSGIAQSQVGDLQKQFQETGQRPDMAQLNQLEQLGANTFGTGMRGRFDYAGSGQQPISRSQVGQFRNTFNDPSLQVFDRKTGMNPIGLGIGDYANYYQGREDRLAKTPLGGIMNTISDLGDKAMQYSPLNYIVPQSFRTTPPNRQIPSALQEELEGTKLPPNVSFTPPSGLASIKIPSLADLLSNLDFGAQKNKNQDDLTMDKMITAKGMSQGGYGGEDRKPKNLGIKTSLSPAGDEFDITALLGKSSDNLSKLGAELVNQGLVTFTPLYMQRTNEYPGDDRYSSLSGTRGFFSPKLGNEYDDLLEKFSVGTFSKMSEEDRGKPAAFAFMDQAKGAHYVVAEETEDGELPEGAISAEIASKRFDKEYTNPIIFEDKTTEHTDNTVNHELRHAAIDYLDKKYPKLFPKGFLQYRDARKEGKATGLLELIDKAGYDEEAQMHYHDRETFNKRLGYPVEAFSDQSYTKKFKRFKDYEEAFNMLNDLADQEILNLTRPKKEAYSEDDYETMNTASYSPTNEYLEDDYEMRDDSKYRGLGGTILKSLFPNMIE